jgi:hypothetical protein
MAKNRCEKCGKYLVGYDWLDDNGFCRACHDAQADGSGEVTEKAQSQNESQTIPVQESTGRENLPANNTVAQIIKVCAVMYGIIALIMAGAMAASEQVRYSGMSAAIFFMILGAGAVTSLGIYAFGEIIDLLQGIKNNTSKY